MAPTCSTWFNGSKGSVHLLVVLLCGDGLFGPRAAEGACSEGPSPISPWLCGGGAGGSFGNLGAAHSLSPTQPPLSVVRPPSSLTNVS